MNKITITMIVLLMIINISGCSFETTEVESKTSEASTIEATTTPVPERKAEVMGIIKNVIGNEVSVSLLLKNTESEENMEQEALLTDEEKAAKQAEKKAANQAANARNIEKDPMEKVELSGEMRDVVIPVGTKVVQSTGTGEFIDLNIGDILKGTSVKIWLIEDGEGEVAVAEFVQLQIR
ncbi:hypothetical protein [Petrocella sp. FN5]|uniref:hypothetical protein n=1 Tax=Petrocella sp. FN5 TaxID=3032002 RepID=UPI0023DB5881|nr:hypothetical protein [Petrocella sp. FN5]MDF1616431.1 hypothetical protein [Petrocella sp. FN5]